MKIKTLRARNFKSFVDTGLIELGPINVLVGANNAGKSSILRALHLLQIGGPLNPADIRVGTSEYTVDIEISQATNVPRWHIGADAMDITHAITVMSSDRRSINYRWSIYRNIDTTVLTNDMYQVPAIEPQNFIVPYFARRKTATYSEDVREEAAMRVSVDMSNLAAKLTRISNPFFPNHSAYAKSCQDILGFVVTNIPSGGGQRPGVWLESGEAIDIDLMGEGVPNIVQLLVNLATSSNKLFLIEEPENDIHPQALRALLDLVLHSSQTNQFVISTHSNIVVSHLCGSPRSKLFEVTTEKGRLPPLSAVEEIDSTPTARLRTLVQLGYSLADFGLWSGYIIFEEASAEYIARQFLIPMFAPTLSRIRTISAGGVSNVEPAFADLNRLTLFLHLEPVYHNRAWVLVDGDKAGKEAIARLREKYGSAYDSFLLAFDREQFEEYYPSRFESEVAEVLSISARDKRRIEKQKLLLKVVAWLEEDPERARESLLASAKTVIDVLLRIEQRIAANSADV